ncbi:extracellular solute-binding protein (plasmid) [Croceibacterium sp. TMG7-5b_MA50]|uniref:extracellular solute-binding protein n=1 Tax=Croceibacterium sp. TMG7-5b_MA50 TaxID=3121290 RepID=UPI003221902C
MTWDHPRGYDPLAAAAREWAARTGVEIAWDRRSLQDFESYPVEELARAYDLIVIDHPHVGQVAAEGALLPLDGLADDAALAAIAAGSVGGSYDSYHWQGRQWALPIDAAAQVQAWVPDRIDGPVSDWAEVLRLAEEGRLTIPLRAPHALMSLFTLCGLDGIVPDPAAEHLFPAEAASACRHLQDLADRVGADAWGHDPIAVLDAMADPTSPVAVAPLTYGYVSYSRPVAGATAIRFADLPLLGTGRPTGSALGGTGIAISAWCKSPGEAAAFAAWVAGAGVQRGLYAAAGGQPGHADAWADDEVNAATQDFYRATRATLDAAWLRPRHHGYMAYQQAASERLERGLRRNEAADSIVAALNAMYRTT